MEKITLLKDNLIKLGYQVTCFNTSIEASTYLNEQINQQTVGFAGSMTLEKMGLYESLSTHNTVYWHHRIPLDKTHQEVRKQANQSSIYISSVNAITLKGEIVNIDATCNRVASIFYGHEKVYLVIGKNKIEKDYESAYYRARNIASPLNAKRLGVNTPCAIKADKCYDCNSPQRICRGLSVLWSKPLGSDYEIILINEELGY